jgi:hypothetical protein
MVDRRTALDRANDELAESLLKCGDATTVAIVIRFIDQMRDIADRVLVRDYSAERLLSVGWPQSWMRHPSMERLRGQVGNGWIFVPACSSDRALDRAASPSPVLHTSAPGYSVLRAFGALVPHSNNL